MSNYTTELRFICESLAGKRVSQPISKVDEILSTARTKIFDFDYPCFDEEYKSVLETKILRHFYTREIGFETYGLWKLKLETKMNEIMPYYNKLYNSELIEFDPMKDFDYSRTYNKDSAYGGTSSSNDSSDTSSSSADKFSDTPQGGLSGVTSGTYLTNARIIDGNSDSLSSHNSTSNYTNTDQYIENLAGKHGATPYSTMLQEFRKTFLNIDMQIITDLEDLFMLVW